MKVYSAWGGEDDEFPTTFIEGKGPPRFANGETCPDSTKFFYEIEAENWESAMTLYHIRQGWEPYKPM